MRMGFILLTSACLLAFLYQPGFSNRWKPRRVKGLLLFSKSKCANRCNRKHGYFLDKTGQIQDASAGKNYLLKCQCEVSRQLKTYIKDKFGEKAAKSYSRSNLIGRTEKAREKLRQVAIAKKITPIAFIQLPQLAEHVEQQQRAAQATATATTKGHETGSALSGGVSSTMTTYKEEDLSPTILQQLMSIKAKEDPTTATVAAANGDVSSASIKSVSLRLSPEQSKHFEKLIHEHKEKMKGT